MDEKYKNLEKKNSILTREQIEKEIYLLYKIKNNDEVNNIYTGKANI
jgi:hypothetical protein